MYLCRVDSTLLYINIDEKYKDDAKKLIEAMGY
jgi:antitoxin component of RelBE/YafQ-DinJ toxin-antitoxin module